MSRSRWLSVVLVACAAGLIGTGLALPRPALASASPAGSPSVLPALRALPGVKPGAEAPAAGTPKENTVTATYSCDFSKYGTGIPATTISATAGYPSSWPVGQPLAFGVVTTALTLPTPVSSQLTSADAVVSTAQVNADKATATAIPLAGAATGTPPLTVIPEMITVGQATFPAKGTGALELPPPSIVFTPLAGTAVQPAITCTTQTASAADDITVETASGPFYHCTLTIPTVGTAAVSDFFAVTVKQKGKDTAGGSVTVSLSSADLAALIDANAPPATKAVVDVSLPVSGAQAGTLHLSTTTEDMSATTLAMSGALRLTKAGTTTLDIPSSFSVTLSDTSKLAEYACTLVTKPAPVAATLHVTAADPASRPSASASATPTATTAAPAGGGQGEGAGTPAGGAATGGGLAPGADVPVAVGGLAIALAGGGLLTRGVARSRRRR